MNEGYMALLVAILRHVSVERAFELLDSPRKKYTNRKWTQEDISDIEAFRAQGMSWGAIANVFGVSSSTANRMYRYHKERRKQ